MHGEKSLKKPFCSFLKKLCNGTIFYLYFSGEAQPGSASVSCGHGAMCGFQLLVPFCLRRDQKPKAKSQKPQPTTVSGKPALEESDTTGRNSSTHNPELKMMIESNLRGGVGGGNNTPILGIFMPSEQLEGITCSSQETH